MKEFLFASACGLSTLLVENIYLHSKYDPAVEAKKYVENLNYTNNIKYFILVECGLCYVIPHLRNKFQNTIIISIHISDWIADNVIYNADFSWKPSSLLSLSEFLQDVIHDIEAEKIKIIEWRPSLQVYADKYLNTLSIIVRFIKQADANKRTIGGFGKKWFCNAIRNCLLIKNIITIKPISANCIVAAAGVSLEKNIGKVRKAKQSGAFLIVAASAAPFLFDSKIIPDIIVTTDGGSWALRHLNDVWRCLMQAKLTIPLAFSLNACLPSYAKDLPLIPIADGSLWQNIILSSFLHGNFLSFPGRGTVSAAAIDLALSITSGNIFLTGIDFSNSDIKTHCASYSFDKIFRLSSCRFNPYYNIKYKRCNAIADAGTYSIYRNWFNENIYNKKNIYSIDDMQTTDICILNNKNDFNDNYTSMKINIAKSAAGITKNLIKALSLAETKHQVNKELSSLLLNNTIENGKEDTENEILKLTEKYRRHENING